MARRTSENSPRERLRPLDQEHYEVARSLEGFFDEGEFSRRYFNRYPGRHPARIRPARYSFNRGRFAARRKASFLWWDGDESYVFVGLNGAPKSFLKNADEKSSIGVRKGKSDVLAVRQNNHEGLHLDVKRAREIAEQLYGIFLPNGPGIFGEHKASQGILPVGMQRGSREHLLFLTFTNSMNRRRDALDLWRRASGAWSDAGTRWLFEPEAVSRTDLKDLNQELRRLGVSKMGRVDAGAWLRIAKTLQAHYGGDPRQLFEAHDYHAPTILRHIRANGNWQQGGTRWSFPLLRGNKIAPLWIRMLRDAAGLEFRGLEDVPIAVDVHVLRATLCTGAITGRFMGGEGKAFERVRKLWKEATRGLVREDGQQMVPLDIDEALWTLSGRGCARRGNGALKPCPAGCPLAGTCAEGRLEISDGRCEADVYRPS